MRYYNEIYINNDKNNDWLFANKIPFFFLLGESHQIQLHVDNQQL